MSSRFGTAPGVAGFGGVSRQMGQSLAGLFGAGGGRRSNLGTGGNFTPRQARNVTQIGGYTPISSQASFDRYFQSRLGRTSGLPSFESMRINKGGGQVGGGQVGGGSVNSGVGNSGYPVDDANNEVARASATYGVPASFLKAIITRESSGNWARDGSRLVNLRNDTILPYVGIFNSAWQSWGCPGDVWQASGNRQAQVDCLARGMRMWYDRAKAQNPSYGWSNVAAMHFSGNFDPNNGFCDENGMCTTTYVRNFEADMARFDAAAGAMGGQSPAPSFGGPSVGGGPATAGISTVWGNKGNPDLSYGFLAPNNLGLYAYGTEYGTDGRGHTGIDIPQPLEAPIYSAAAGTVVCACTGNGPGGEGRGCASFNDVNGQGCGRVEVKLDNGDTLIYGHVSTATVRVGQRVNVGDQVATNGGMNGPHVHLEYRTPDPTTPSGWRIVDPAKFLGGAGVSGFPGSPSDVGGGYAAMQDKWAALGINMNSSYGFGGGRRPQRFMSDWRR